jgi:CheY-like chemotaxis protein
MPRIEPPGDEDGQALSARATAAESRAAELQAWFDFTLNTSPIVGVGRLLPKPFTPAQLLEAVRGALENPT